MKPHTTTRGHLGLISTGEAGWLQRFGYLWVLLKWGMGLPLALLVAFGVLRAMISLKGKTGEMPILEALLLAFVIPYLLFIGIHKIKFTRHLLILYPALTLLAAIVTRQSSRNHTQRFTVSGIGKK